MAAGTAGAVVVIYGAWRVLVTVTESFLSLCVAAVCLVVCGGSLAPAQRLHHHTPSSSSSSSSQLLLQCL